MEKFISIIGWEGLYEISNKGRIKCLNYLHHKNKIHITNGIKMKNGYMKYELKSKGKKQVYLIHRLVALHFIENSESKKCVNHKNGIKHDNSVENLEWCTYKENNIHALRNGLCVNSLKRFKGIKIDDKSEVLFDNTQDAAYYVGGNRSNIHKCLKKKENRTIAYGYNWEYL